jgi:hypothetical protein
MKGELLLIACIASLVLNPAIAAPKAEEAAGHEVTIVLNSEVEWTHLNPKRGDLAPKAGTLWGNLKGTGPTGFLLKPTDGFESPPHIHNVSYRGVVIRGLIHNDDPNAADMWMPAGSFWTQPRGEVHVTAARGADSLAYIEIEAGPYLVLPSEEALDSGERPVNVDVTNIVWLNAADLTWIEPPGKTANPNGPKIAFLWGGTQQGQLNGTLIKLPAGFDGELRSPGFNFRAVVIMGLPQYHLSETAQKTLEPGSYFSSDGAAAHRVSSSATKESVLYVRTDGPYQVVPLK